MQTREVGREALGNTREFGTAAEVDWDAAALARAHLLCKLHGQLLENLRAEAWSQSETTPIRSNSSESADVFAAPFTCAVSAQQAACASSRRQARQRGSVSQLHVSTRVPSTGGAAAHVQMCSLWAPRRRAATCHATHFPPDDRQAADMYTGKPYDETGTNRRVVK